MAAQRILEKSRKKEIDARKVIAHSPLALSAIVAIVIFVYEAMIMVVLLILPPLPYWIEVIADPVFLLIFLLPSLYFFMYRPLSVEISERGQLEERLRNNVANLDAQVKEKDRDILKIDERLKYLLNATPAMIYSGKPAGDYGATFISENVKSILGYESEDFIKDSGLWINHVHEQDRKEVIEKLAGLSSAGFLIYEYRFQRKDGTYVWMHDESKIIDDEKGNPLEIVGFWMDITRQKQDEESLRELNAFNRAVVHTIPFGLDIVDSEYTILFLNQKLEAIFGKEALGKKCWQLYRDQKAPCLDCPLSRGINIGETSTIETSQLFGGRIVQISHTAMMYQGRKAILEIFQDITERKQSEEELAKLSAAVMQTADLVMITDKSGIIEYVNNAFEELTGYKKEEVIGKTPHILKSGKHNREFYDRLWKTISRGEVFRDVLVNRKENGEFYYSEKTITPIKDTRGNITNFISTDKDITQRKEAEDGIRLLQAIIFSVSEADNLDLALVNILRMICEFTGWNIGELWIPNVPSGYLEYASGWCGDDECLENFMAESKNLIFPLGVGALGRILASKEVNWIANITAEPDFLRKDSALRCGLKTHAAFPIKVKDQVVAVAEFFSSEYRQEEEKLIKFISIVAAGLGSAILRKRYEEELMRANRELLRLDRLKTDFITTVSHELRTPIGIMREGVSQVAEGLHGGLNQEQKNFLNKSLHHMDRLTKIVNSILDISKLEAGTTGLRMELTDMAAVANTAISIFEPVAKNKGLDIKSDFAQGIIELNADKDKLTQVFTCLIENAIKFTDRGYIEVKIQDKGNAIECSIQDTGIGILPEELSKVFDKFQQFSRVYGPGEKGVGLGLAIAKSIVELHRGKIWVESEVNKGAKFSFMIPKRQKAGEITGNG